MIIRENKRDRRSFSSEEVAMSGISRRKLYALEDKRLLRVVLPPAAHRCKRGLRRSRSRRRRECSAAAWQKARLFSPLTSHWESGHSATRRNSAKRLAMLGHEAL